MRKIARITPKAPLEFFSSPIDFMIQIANYMIINACAVRNHCLYPLTPTMSLQLCSTCQLSPFLSTTLGSCCMTPLAQTGGEERGQQIAHENIIIKTTTSFEGFH